MLLGVLCCYHTSQRAMITNTNKITYWISIHYKKARTIGALLILISLSISIVDQGMGSGFFAAFVMLMSILSLVVLTAPLQFFKWTVLITLVVLSFIIEFLIF